MYAVQEAAHSYARYLDLVKDELELSISSNVWKKPWRRSAIWSRCAASTECAMECNYSSILLSLKESLGFRFRKQIEIEDQEGEGRVKAALNCKK